MFSERKVTLLNAFCDAHLASPDPQAVTVPWSEQVDHFWPMLHQFRQWLDAPFTHAAALEADTNIANRAAFDQWLILSPSGGRMLLARLTQATALIIRNGLDQPHGGVSLPAGLSPDATATALLIYWCYEMELPLPVPSGAGGTG